MHTMAPRETLRRQLAIRLTEEDVRRLDALVGIVPVATKNALAREALRLGMGLLEKNPRHLLRPKRSRRSKGR